MAKRKRSSYSGRRAKRPRLYRRKRVWRSYKKRVKKALFGIAETKRYQSPLVYPYYLGVVNQPERLQMITTGLLQPIQQGDKSFQREGSSIFLRGIKFTLQIFGENKSVQNHRLVLFWHPQRSSTLSITSSPELNYLGFPSLLLSGASHDSVNHFLVPYDPKRVKVVKSWNFQTYPAGSNPISIVGGEDNNEPYNSISNKFFRRYVKLNRKITYDEDDATEPVQYTKGWQLYLGYIWDGAYSDETNQVTLSYTLYYKDF